MNHQIIPKEKYTIKFFNQTQKESDVMMNFFLAGLFVIGLLLSFFYDTWTVAMGVGSLALIAYYSAKNALPDSNLYQYVLAAVLGVFMAQYIYQMHGLFEMHFIAFIASAILITYQNWRLQIPLALVVIVHHAVFGYLQFIGFDKIYFTQLDYMSLQTFIIHGTLATAVFLLCGFWAYRIRKYTEKNIEQSYEIGRMEEDQLQKDALIAMSKELEISNERLKEAQRISHVGNWVWDLTNNNVYGSDEVFRILERTPEQMKEHEGFGSNVHPDDKQHVDDIIAKALADRRPFSFEARVLSGQHQVKTIFCHAQLSINEKDEVAAIHGIVQDITDRKLAEQKLAETSNQLNILFNTVDEGLFSMDMTTFQYINLSKANEKIYGYTLEEFFANPRLWYEVILPKDKIIVDKNDELIHQGKIVHMQFRFFHKDKSIRWAEAKITPTLNKEGKLIRIDGSVNDITSKKQSEIALHESQEQIKTIFNASLDAVVIIDEQGKITKWDTKAEKLFGWKEGEVMGTELTENIIPHQHREAHRRGMAQFVKTGVEPVLDKTFEIRALKKNNEEFDISLSISPSQNNGKYQFISFIRDITSRKKAEEALRQNELQFREFFEAAPEAIAVLDLDSGKFTDFNSNMLKLCKYSREELFQKTPVDLSPELQPDGSNSASKSMKIIAGAVAGEKPIFEWTHCDAHGNHIPCEVRLIKLSVPGRNLLRASIIDITEKKKALEALSKSEADMRAIFDNTDIGYLLIDASFKICSYNKQVQKFAKISLHRSFETGDSLLEFFEEGEQRNKCTEKLQRVIKGESISYESNLQDRDGSALIYAVSMFPVLNKHNEVMGIAMSVVDITGQKKVEQEIKMLNESLEEKVKERTSELEAANKEMESFSYSVSHDLRGPLRIINGFAKLLLRKYADKLDKDGRENLEIIMSNTKNMGQLIDDLLDLSRTGRAELKKNILDMNEMVKTIIEEVKSVDHNAAEVRLLDLKPASADPALLKQVWVNLISNAAKYSRKKEKPVIEIGTIGENGHLIYYVKDNGAGFDMEYYDKLFGVFQRLHKVTEYEGTGVGLALTQRIINRHGGKIWAESKVNEGATFYFTLPK